MRVVILSKSNYKEKDCIYNAICPEGLISFLAKGAQDPKSKFVWLNNQMTVVEVEFLNDGRYKHKVINNASLVSSPMVSAGNYDYLVAINAVSELSQHVLLDEEKKKLFNEIEPVLNALRIGKDYRMVILLYIVRLLRISGTELEVGCCVRCGSKNDIVAFSFEEGGFVCNNCLVDTISTDLSPIQLKLIRYIFKAKDYSLPEIDQFSLLDKKIILKKLVDFIDEYVGVKLNSLDPLYK